MRLLCPLRLAVWLLLSYSFVCPWACMLRVEQQRIGDPPLAYSSAGNVMTAPLPGAPGAAAAAAAAATGGKAATRSGAAAASGGGGGVSGGGGGGSGAAAASGPSQMTTRQTRRGRRPRDDDAPVTKRPRGSKFIPLAAAAGDYATSTVEGDSFRDTYRCVRVLRQVVLMMVQMVVQTVLVAVAVAACAWCCADRWSAVASGLPAGVSARRMGCTIGRKQSQLSWHDWRKGVMCLSTSCWHGACVVVAGKCVA